MTIFVIRRLDDKENKAKTYQISFLNDLIYFSFMAALGEGTHVTFGIGIKKLEMFIGISKWNKLYESTV